jgi:hypothetical protein
MIEQLVEIATLLEIELNPDRVAVTDGEPAVSDSCSAVYVWGVRIFDSPTGVTARGDEAGCLYRRAYEMAYRIDVCHPVTEAEPDPDDYLAAATRLYDLADRAWCALADAASSGILFQGADCEDVVIRSIDIGPPQGDRLSAQGGVLLTWPCEAPGS